MKVLVLIPARYGSSRFPGKPLAKINGIEMIVRVCRRVAETGFSLCVATDDQRIFDTVTANGFRATLTRADHPSGTDRLAEAYHNLGEEADVIVNVQGDEPFIHPEQIKSLVEIFKLYPETKLATLARPFDKSRGFSALRDPNLVKLVKSQDGKALYFSRSVIPYVRNAEESAWPDKTDYFTHVGIYAYRPETLLEVVKLPRSPLEIAESLEQLRWLENGYSIRVTETTLPTIGIDTPEDLARISGDL